LEVDVEKLSDEILLYRTVSESPESFIQYRPISDLPSSFKDISYSINDYSKVQDLQDLLLDYQSDFIKNVYIFDYFKNEKKEEIKIGFRFIFQSKDKTITSTQMDEVYSDIVKKSLGIGGVSIPGLFIDR
jgi:phenylalanyl-tRNA synthetase beta subunit